MVEMYVVNIYIWYVLEKNEIYNLKNKQKTKRIGICFLKIKSNTLFIIEPSTSTIEVWLCRQIVNIKNYKKSKKQKNWKNIKINNFFFFMISTHLYLKILKWKPRDHFVVKLYLD